MTNQSSKPAQSRNFSLAFEQMVSFVAIAQTRSPNETIRELIIQCFVIDSTVPFHNAADFIQAIDVYFGLEVLEFYVQQQLDRLVADGVVIPVSPLSLAPALIKEAQTRIEDAKKLEVEVKANWFTEIKNLCPGIAHDQAWEALRLYLARAFRRHGIQATALLDPTSLDPFSDYAQNLSTLLNDSVKDFFPANQYQDAKSAISLFLAKAGSFPERAKYISQLADGAFNYFSLTVDPELAKQFRKKLSNLTLLLDTNFLFGILDLHSNPQVEVSKELVKAVSKNHFPFTLRYLPITYEELNDAIDHYVDKLRASRYSQKFSQMVQSSPALSGIELSYHRKNAVSVINVETFLNLYSHVDILLGEQNIKVYNSSYDFAQRLYERSALFHDYVDFLKSNGKEKPDDIIDHDTTVLDIVHQLRTKNKSSLEAGALFLTCDYTLYKFDWEQSRAKNELPCTVLPSIFWQILRPFVPNDIDFERSFASTFAIPEFRTIRSEVAEAASRLAGLLATYEGLSSETAMRILANEAILGNLTKIKDQEEFQNYVEAEIVKDNARLLEEIAAHSRQLEREKEEKTTLIQKNSELEQDLKFVSRQINTLTQDMERLKEDNLASKTKITEIEVTSQKRIELIEEAAQRDRENARQAEEEARQAQEDQKALEKKLNFYYRSIPSIALIILLIGIFEALIYLSPWQWFSQHTNSYGLQLAWALAVILLVIGLFYPKTRNWCWGISLLPIVATLVQIIGGPSSGK